MEFKGTKGEWRFKLDELRESDHYNSFELDFDFSETSANNLTLWCHSDELTEEELSNAKLIAAAPDLLEALIRLTANAGLQKYVYDNQGTLLSESFDKAKQAIEKALK